MLENRWRRAGMTARRILAHPARGTAAAERVTAGVRRTWAGTEALRVLIVDDNRDAADSLAMLVTHWGYDARLAYGGAAALESALAGPPHVVLLDIGMPRMDGFRLASLMRKQTRLAGALLIAVTGYGDAAHRELWEAMFDIYLVKPVDPSTVEQLLLREKIRLAARSGGLGNNGCGPTVTDVALRYRARSG